MTSFAGTSVQPPQGLSASFSRYCQLVTGDPPSSPGVQFSVIRRSPAVPAGSVGAAGTTGSGVARASFEA